MRLRFTNGSVATPGGVLDGAMVVLAGDRIATIEAGGGGPVDRTIDLDGGWLMPGFVDTQVNGGGGVLLNDHPTVEGMAAIASAHRVYGTTALMPTLISDTPATIARALDALDAAVAAGVRGIVGLHIEGPVLNPARKGIHEATLFRALDDDLVALLGMPRRGRVMVTLAPEMTTPETIRTLVAAGVIVSAGHSEADEATMYAAFDAGLTGITHLFNAMPPLHQRAPGVVGATLDDPRPWAGLIVDDVHVADSVLRLAVKARPFDRLMLVTDAMSSVSAATKDFVLQGRRIVVRDGICRYSDGTLAGSDLDMAAAVANAVRVLRIAPDQAAAMAATHPAAFLGLAHERGSLAPGLRADWVVLRADLTARETWIGGEVAAA